MSGGTANDRVPSGLSQSFSSAARSYVDVRTRPAIPQAAPKVAHHSCPSKELLGDPLLNEYVWLREKCVRCGHMMLRHEGAIPCDYVVMKGDGLGFCSCKGFLSGADAARQAKDRLNQMAIGLICGLLLAALIGALLWFKG